MNSSVQMDFCACIQCQVTKFRNQKAKIMRRDQKTRRNLLQIHPECLYVCRHPEHSITLQQRLKLCNQNLNLRALKI